MSTAPSVVCPGCHAKLRTSPANAGRTLACPKCGSMVSVPGSAAAATLAGADPESAHKPLWRGPALWTPMDRLWVRTGVSCMIFGTLAHVLPLFGLQFRKLSSLGASAGTVGTGVLVLGAVLVLYVCVMKGRMLVASLSAAGVLAVAFAGLMTIGYCSSHRGRPTPAPFGGPAPGGPYGAPGPGGPGFTPPPTPTPTPTPTHPRIDYDSLVQRFGAERVVRITFKDAKDLDIGATIRQRLATLDAAARPTTWSAAGGDPSEFVAGPVTDFETFAASLDMGAIEASDNEQRRVIIAADAGKCVPKKR